ncbi:MAG: phospholipase D-like domain-containing protein [Methanomassiliicoccales archaeon]
MTIQEVFPDFRAEYVVISNQGDDAVTLDGWKVTDGEGVLALPDVPLEQDRSIILASDPSTVMGLGLKGEVLDIDDLIQEGSFILANKGDEVILLHGERAVDAMVYGDSEYEGEGWDGEPIEKPGKGRSLRRQGGDTNSSQDWLRDRPGRTDLVSFNSTGWAEPFLIPEEGMGRLAREIEHASRSIRLCVYEIDHPLLVSALGRAAARGVNVTLLVEGNPVGGMSDSGSLDSLVTSGARVVVSESDEGFRRYAYYHCKYMVVDERRTVVTSENWLESSLSSNRGWGMVIRDRELAIHMSGLFAHDVNLSMLDNRLWTVAEPSLMEGVESDLDHRIERYPAEVGTLVSPDFSLEGVLDLLGSSEERVLVEMFYADPEWMEDSGILPALVSGARRGVETKMLLDSSWFSEGKGNDDLVHRLNGMGLDHLEAASVSTNHSFRVLHNKGMVVDDTVLISSMNWVPTAFEENREVGLLVESEEVADFFAHAFQEDWCEDPIPPSIALPESIEGEEGTPVLLDARECSDNIGISVYEWDLEGDGGVDHSGPVHLVHLPPGRHTVTLRVEDLNGNTATGEMVVVVRGAEEGHDPLVYAPLGAAVPPLIWMGVKRLRSRKL